MRFLDRLLWCVRPEELFVAKIGMVEYIDREEKVSIDIDTELQDGHISANAACPFIVSNSS